MALIDNVIAYYKLDDVLDETANSYDLTNTGTVTFSAGKIGDAADMGNPNTTKHLRYEGNMGLAGDGAKSFAFWYNRPDTTGGQIAGIRSTLTNDRYLVIETTTGGLQLNASNAFDTHTEDITGAWHHIVVTRAAGSTGVCKVYLDSVEVMSVNSGTSAAGTNRVAMGNGGGGGFSEGSFDEYGVWDVELAQADVDELYNSGAGNQYPFTGGGVTFIPQIIMS